MGGRSKGKNKRPVFDYHMGLHYGLALGPLDALFGIRIKDTLAWPPEQTAEENVVERMPTGLDYLKINMGHPIEECIDPAHPEVLTTQREVLIDEEKLFGGDERSGGVHGLAMWLPGRDDQVIPDFMSRKLGVTPAMAPGFRGMGSVFFTGARQAQYFRDQLGQKRNKLVQILRAKIATGFRWGSNDPRHPAASFRAFRVPRAEPLSSWVATYGPSRDESQVLVIENPKGSPRQDDEGKDLPAGGGFPTANPAAVLYELIASGAYDMAATEAMMDTESFILAARIFSKEKMGVSIFWDASDGADELVAEICDHVGALVFLHPRTGLYTIRVLRADKVFEELWQRSGVDKPLRPELTGFRITPANAVIDGDIKARAPAELPNSMDVKYTLDDTEETGVVTIMSQSAIAAAGGAVNHAVRDRPFFRSEAVALKAAERELRIASTPALRMTVLMDRSAWAITYGDVVTVDWPSEGIANRRFRVAEVEHKDRDIRLDIIEDIFATEEGQVATAPARRAWTPPAATPTVSHPYVTSLPAAMMIEGGMTKDEIDSMAEEGDEAVAHLLGTRGSLIAAEAFVRTNTGQWPEQGMPVIATPVARTVARMEAGEAESDIDLYALDFGAQEQDIEVGDKLIFVRDDPWMPGWQVSGSNTHNTTNMRAILALPDGPRQEPAGATHMPYKSTFAGFAALALDPASTVHDSGKGLAPYYREEIAEVVDIDLETGMGRIKRGIHDTVPADIPSGTLVYHWQGGRVLPLPRLRSVEGERYVSAYLPQSAAGAAKNRVPGPHYDAMRRHDLPARPGNATITTNGESTGLGGKLKLESPAAVQVSWRSRNRMLDDANPSAWDDGNVTPEDGMAFYVILWRRFRVRTPAGNSNLAVMAAKWSNLSGNSFTIPAGVIANDMADPDAMRTGMHYGDPVFSTDIAAGASYAVEIGAHRGDAVSLQRALLLFDVAAQTSGYGLDYGNDYGGTD